MSFPATMQASQAPAFAGDFASANPRFTLLAGPGAIVAGTNLFAGRFAWVDAAGLTANSNGNGVVAGFMGRDQQGLITQFLSESSMQIRVGGPVTIYSGGDFWVVNSDTDSVQINQKVYANYATGLATFAATGTPPSNGSATGSIAANATTTATGSITDNIMTLASAIVGTWVAGGTISGTNVVSGTTVVKQLTGTTGGIGTYEVSIEQVVASTTITETYGVFTAASGLTGGFAVGNLLSGTSVVAGTYITQFGTGTGGLGTYYVSNNTVVSSTTISATAAIETKWYAQSVGYPGELIKISSQPIG